MPRKPGGSSSDGKSKKKKKKSRERSLPGTAEKDMPPEMIPDENVPMESKPRETEAKPRETNAPCSISIRIPPPMLCMRTAVPKRVPSRPPPARSGSKSLCPTLAAVSNPAAFCPPVTGEGPCPIVSSRTCGPETCLPSRKPVQTQSQPLQPEGLQPQQECQQTEPQQQLPPQQYQQPQELQSQAPIIVCSPSQLSLAQRIAAEGTLPPPEVVSSQSRVCSAGCQQPLARSMPSVPDQFQSIPPPGYYGMAGEGPGQPGYGQTQWARSLPNFDGAAPCQEDHRDTPMPGLEGPSYAAQQPFYQTPTVMPPPSGGSGNLPQWSESFPLCCSPSDSSGTTVQVPLTDDISHVVTIDIRVRAVQKPPSGISINKVPNEEGLMNQQVYPGGSQNRMPIDAYQYDPARRPPSGAARMPETPPTAADQTYPDGRDINPSGGFGSPAYSSEVPPENNQQISSGPIPCPFKNQTGQSGIPGRTGVCGSQSQGFDSSRQVIRCPSYGATFPQNFSRGQRYTCTSSQMCPGSQRWASGGQEPYPPPQQANFPPAQQEMTAPGCGPMQFQSIPPPQSAQEPRPLSSCTQRSSCSRMSPNPSRAQEDQTGPCWMRPRSGSDPRFQTSAQPELRRSGGSFLNSILDVLPSISAVRASRPNRSIRMAEPENDQTPLNPTQGQNRTRNSRSETPGSRAQGSQDPRSDQYPLINSSSEPRRKRRSMS